MADNIIGYLETVYATGANFLTAPNYTLISKVQGDSSELAATPCQPHVTGKYQAYMK